MKSFQESKQELEAAIRYAENAISSAQDAIQSMLNYQEQTGREEALTKQVRELESKVQGQYDDIVLLEREIEKLRNEKEASSGPCGCQAYRDLEEARGRAEGEVELLQRTIADLEAQVNALEQPEHPTMPVIPKAVAIAIFREGMAYGAGNVCDELDNATDIEISDRECMGNFEVEYTQYVNLSDHLDTDYLRSKAVDNSDEEWVVDCLKTLCADNKFECRIHGVDDQES